MRQEREACERQLTEAIKNETEKCEQLLKVTLLHCDIMILLLPVCVAVGTK